MCIICLASHSACRYAFHDFVFCGVGVWVRVARGRHPLFSAGLGCVPWCPFGGPGSATDEAWIRVRVSETVSVESSSVGGPTS